MTDLDAVTRALGPQTACLVVQYPNFFGGVEDLVPLAEAAHAVGALCVVCVAEPIALGLLKSPGECGADLVTGEGQGLGTGMNYGGPALGFLATREQYVRHLPGRLVGQTVDRDGRPGYVLTLATREQHIRREKATSNICTSESLIALMATIYLVSMGPQGLARGGAPEPAQGGVRQGTPGQGAGVRHPVRGTDLQRVRRAGGEEAGGDPEAAAEARDHRRRATWGASTPTWRTVSCSA